MSDFDLFVSHAEADRWWVEGYLLDALGEAGVRVQREASFQLGAPRLQEFARAVATSRRTLLVLSPAFMADGAAQFVALLAQQYGLDTRTWPVIPLTLQALDRPDPTLALLVDLDARAPADWPAVLRRLCADLQRPLPDAGRPPPCPYPGMRAFRADEGPAFFGRDAEVRALIEQHLRLYPFVALIGASGSGKSSLVFAGLLPALRQSPFFGGGDWDLRTLRPGSDPAAALQAALQPPAPPGSGPRLLVVDQFEELFSLARTLDDAGRAAFCQSLLALPGSGWHVVLTVRADFYGDLMRLGAFWAEVRQHRFELTPLGRDALRETIVGPAARQRVLVEPALVERLMADAGDEPGILPFLQETLVLLWSGLERRCLPATAYERLVADARRLDPAGQRARSGLEVAMAARADQALASLPSDVARDIARRLLLRLVQFGEGRSDTRRQQRVGQLRSEGEDAAVFDATLRHLISARLVIASGAEGAQGADATPLDIAHEALLSGWPQLARWIAQRREGEQARRWLRERAERWLERVESGLTGGLLDDVETAEAERWRDRFGQLVGRDAAVEQLIDASRREVDGEREALEQTRRRELEQQTRLAAEQRARADDAERFAREQVALNAQLRQSAAANAFVQATALLEAGTADRAMARVAQTLRLAPQHEPARALLYALLTRHWHLRPRGVFEHDDPVRRLLLSPDGRFLVCGSDRRTWVHDRQEGSCAELPHTGHLQSLELSPDGGRLLTASTTYGEMFGAERHVATGTIELWQLDSGERLHVGEVRGLVTKAVFGDAGQRVYVSSAFGPAALDATLQPAPDRWPEDVDRQLYTTDNTWSDLVVHPTSGHIVWLGMPQMVGEGELYSWEHWGQGPVQRSQQPGFSAFVFGPDGRCAAFSGPLLPPGMRGLGIGMRPGGFSGVLDLDPLALTAEPLRHGDLVSALVANDSCTRLLSASVDHCAVLWSPVGARALAELQHDAAVTAAAFSPGGFLLATGTAAGAVRVWDGFSGRPVSETVWHDTAVEALAFEPTGRQLVIALTSGRVLFYDTATSVARNAVVETGRPRMQHACFAGDDLLVVRSEDRLEAWDVRSMAQRWEHLPLDEEARIAGVDGDRVLLVDGPRVRVFALADGRELAALVLPDAVMFAAWGDGGQRVVAASRKSLHVLRIDAAGAAAEFTLDRADDAISAARLLCEGRLLVADRERVFLLDMATGKELASHASDAHHLQNTLENEELVRRRHTLSVVDLQVDEARGRVLVIYGHEGASVLQPRYNEHYVVQDAQVWSLSPLAPLAPAFGSVENEDSLNLALPVWSAGRVVSTSNEGDVGFWSLDDGRRVAGPLRQPDAVHHAVVSQDGRQVAVYGSSREVALFDPISGAPIGRPLPHTERIDDVHFLRPGILATWAEGGTLRLWDAATGLQLGPEVAVGGRFRSAGVAASGDLVVSVADPGVANLTRVGDAVLFDTGLDALLDLAEGMGGWAVTSLGIEARVDPAARPDSAAPPALRTLLDWLDDDSPTRGCFHGSPLAGPDEAAQHVEQGPGFLSLLLLDMWPDHPIAWLRLAEAVASGDPREIGVLPQRLRIDSPAELAAVALAWCAHATRCSGGSPAWEERIEPARVALAPAAEAFWRKSVTA